MMRAGHSAHGSQIGAVWKPRLTSLGLFLVALLPRALGLGVFVTADEAKWVYRSAQFLGALLRGDLAGTVVNLTPAVTTTWLGSLGLAAYYALHVAELGKPFAEWLATLPEFKAELDVLVAVRWPMVLLTSFGVVAFYHLARRLVGARPATLFALLLAFDPHFIALSRVLGHDAPAGLFVGLSLLAWLVAQSQTSNLQSHPEKLSGWAWWIASGVLAGLAWLSKSPAFFLAPFVGLVALVESWWRGDAVRAWLVRLVVWAVVAWLVFVVVWPAAWRDPIGTPYAVVHNAFLSATDAVETEAEGYWQVPSLGFLYYPVNGAFKLSVLASLGLLAWLALSLSGRRKSSPVEWWLLAFVVLFTLFMTAGGKRSNRYILPAWPALYLLAAAGLAQISKLASQGIRESGNQGINRSASRITHHASRFTFYVLRFTQYAVRNMQYAVLTIFLLLLILPALLTYPYYLSYFNPLLGGPWTAPRLVKVGWGEGLDQVGHWLAGQPDAPGLRVGSYYASALAPFFPGDIGEVTAGGLDYVVLYRKQVQGGEPSPSILRYFQAEEPVHTVRLDGIDYAWIYAGPAMRPAMANEAAFDIGILPKPLAFRLSHPYLPIGQEATVDVLWLAGDELPGGPSRLVVQPAEDLTRAPGQRANRVFAESPAQLQRRGDGLTLSRHRLKIPDDLPRASYGLLVDGRPLGAADARLFSIPPLDERLDADFGGQVRLIGYAFDAPTGALRLAWQAAPRAWADYTVFVHVLDADGNRAAGADAQPPMPTSQWARGEVIVDERIVSIPQGGTAEHYGLAVGLYRPDTGERLPVLDETGAPVGDRVLLPLSLAAANN